MRDAAATKDIIKAFVAAMAMASILSCSRSKPIEPAIPFKAESKILDTIPDVVPANQLNFSPDGLEVAYRWKASDGRQGFAVNGRIEHYYDEVGDYLHYTRDGTHYAYKAKKGAKEFIVFDGSEEPAYDQVVDPVLSVTGRSHAYAAKSGEDAFIVFNGRRIENKAYDLITPPALSPDGKRITYRAKNKDGRWLYVIDEKESPPYDELEEGYFSRDGRSFAYAGRRNAKWVFVIDGKESAPYDEIDVYPEAADQDIFTAKEGSVEFVVFHGKKGLNYDGVGWPSVSRDGKKVAYEAEKGSKFFVIEGEREGKSYDLTGRPIFSPDGKEIAYDAVDGQQFLMVRNGAELREYLAMPNAVFSPKGGRLAYAAVTMGAAKSFVVEEGKKGKEYDKIGLLAWSPDGRHLAYAAREGDKAFLVVDGLEGKPFDVILSLAPRFSPDGKFVGVNAMKGKEVWWAVEKVE